MNEKYLSIEEVRELIRKDMNETIAIALQKFKIELEKILTPENIRETCKERNVMHHNEEQVEAMLHDIVEESHTKWVNSL